MFKFLSATSYIMNTEAWRGQFVSELTVPVSVTQCYMKSRHPHILQKLRCNLQILGTKFHTGAQKYRPGDLPY